MGGSNVYAEKTTNIRWIQDESTALFDPILADNGASPKEEGRELTHFSEYHNFCWSFVLTLRVGGI